MTIQCPTCQKALPVKREEQKYRPFCSQRCRMADLGGWLMGNYRISSPVTEEDLDEGPPTDGESDPRMN